jgi:mono/diheme cytochrome c family protein
MGVVFKDHTDPDTTSLLESLQNLHSGDGGVSNAILPERRRRKGGHKDRRSMLRKTSVVVIASAGGGLLHGCSGPQPLDRAIRESDESTYRTLTSTGETPGEAYLKERASSDGISLEQAKLQDRALSTTANPFNRRSDPSAVSRGAVIYKNECMVCHGEKVDGRGPQMPVTLESLDFHRTSIRMDITMRGGAITKWFGVIQNGTRAEGPSSDGTPLAVEMPAFEKRLAREQIWLVITYLQSLDADIPANDSTRNK